MDRHDAKPRRPSLLAGADTQRPAPGPPAARILADAAPVPARRRSRRPRHLRAALASTLALASVGALAWAIVMRDAPVARAPESAQVARAGAAQAESSPAMLVEMPSAPRGPVLNPFDEPPSRSAAPAPVVSVPIPPSEAQSRTTQAANPFRDIDTVATPIPEPRKPTDRVAPASASPRASASAQARRASPPVAASEPDLLQALMDNIQAPPAPVRDTAAMDRLARQLDRTPMHAVAAETGAPATPSAASAPPQSLGALLEQCPAASQLQGQRCRRQLCERAGLDPRRCTRH